MNKPTDPKKLKELIIEELENKKVFHAIKPFRCFNCSSGIEQGDDFYFFGEGERICSMCHLELVDFAQERL